ncbi:MAG: Peroxide-responsive repressor PerR [Nitrospirae bacterium]|nr:MAG: ferric uptake regulation protein [Nitrospira sp. OLB3]MBV6470202.1 Peroxide-responsive repressor PerR [Nitrospirota bacterium]MCK6492689.1 transcriptional repressor [Nitrospira sp.]MEB2337240.1 Fur family transcriptional regulator [Nitrospirales bacterium]MCK6497895.1 transcriptional repressor [Nitrospira sp.]
MRTSILRNLRSGGKRLTKPRRAILDLLEKSALPVTAVEIHQGLKKAKVSADLVTVYRNLTMLQNLGLVQPVSLHEGQTRYEVSQGREHHHHIQCRGCGLIVDLMLCPVKKITELVEQQTKFAVEGHALEFFGRCAQCR